MNAFVVKNLWNYESVNPVPKGMEMDTYYITDSEKNRIEALNKGWDYACNISQFKKERDLLKRRSIIGFINCYPEMVCEQLKDYDKIFVTDSNILNLPSNYNDFVFASTDDKACYLTSGYYEQIGHKFEDNILMELERSVNSRWSYNTDAMIRATNYYIHLLQDAGINHTELSVSSAKYIGWNLKHPKRQEIADFVTAEYEKHLQGNIIFTFVYAYWKDYVLNFRFLNDDVIHTPHKFIA